MPQLDKLTYLSQILWIFSISFYFYIFLMLIIFVKFINIKKIKIKNITGVISLFFIFNSLLNAISFYKKKLTQI